MRHFLNTLSLALLVIMFSFVSATFGGNMEAADYFSGKQLTLAKAIDADQPAPIQAALKQGADVNGTGIAGLTPAMFAVTQKKKRGLQTLIAEGADLNKRAEDKNSAVTLATRSAGQDMEWLSIVIEQGKADPNTKMPNEGPLIEYFVATNNTVAIKYLVSKGADPNTIGSNDRPLIVSTAYAGRYQIVELLLKLGGTAHNAELQQIVQTKTRLDVAPDSPDWVARENVKKLINPEYKLKTKSSN